jgi:hypothetical protein
MRRVFVVCRTTHHLHVLHVSRLSHALAPWRMTFSCAFQTCAPHDSEISTGLDASVTYDIVHSFRKRAQADKMSVVMALLQPTPEVFALFDDIILMRDGRVIYHGPRTALPAYLTELGFHVPDHVLQKSGAPEITIGLESGSTSSPTVVTEDMADFLSGFLFLPHKALPEDGIRKGTCSRSSRGMVMASCLFHHSTMCGRSLQAPIHP